MRVTGTDETGKGIFYNIELLFDKDADFECFDSESLIHDGTLLFIMGALELIVEKVSAGIIVNKIKGVPKWGNTIQYTMGNFVILNEHEGDFVPSDKPWI